MLVIIEFLKRFAPMLRSGKMSYGDALTRFRAQFGRQAEGMEKAAIMKEAEKAPSNVFDLTGRQIDTSKPIMGGKNVVETEKGFTPTVVSNKRAEFLKKYTKDGQPNDAELNALVNEHRILSEEAKRLGDAGEKYEKFSQLNKRTEEIEEILDFMNKEFPEGMASGGIARVGMAGGGILKEFIEKLFIKASNDIRQGKGKWAGLSQDQWMKQHDDLTKMLKKWEMSGSKRLPEGAEQYLGMNDLQISKAIKDATSEVEINKVLNQAYDEVAGGSGFSDDYKMAADQLSDSIAEQLGKNFDDLSQTQQTQIQNIALKRTTQDLKKRLSQPTKTLEGIKKEGTIDISDPEVADEFSRFMKESDPKGYKDLEQKIQLSDFDVKGRKKNASGGIAGQLHLNQGGRAGFANGSDYDRFQEAYKKYTNVTDFGSWDPSRTYANYMSDSNFFKNPSIIGYEGVGPDGEPKPIYADKNILLNMYGAPGAGKPYYGASTTQTNGIADLLKKVFPYGEKTLKLGSLLSPVATFLSGGKNALRTPGMDKRYQEMIEKQMRETGKLSGTIGYEDYSKSQAPGTVNPNMYTLLKDLVMGDTTAEDFGNLGQMGTVNWNVNPETGKVDFNRGGSNIYDFKSENVKKYSDDNPLMAAFRTLGRKANENQVAINPDVTISGFGNNQANTLDPRMLGAQDKGLDARMGRTYAENIQAMADPRMLQAKGGRIGYAGGKRTLPKQLSLFARPKIGDALRKLSDEELKIQKRAMKKRWGVSAKANGGLANILGV